MTRKLLLLWGANFELLGTREPHIYGSATLADHNEAAAAEAQLLGYELEAMQSSSVRDLVAKIHQARSTADAIIINPGAFTHYAWAIHDALAMYEGVKIEVHLTNPQSRQPWRHTSVVAPVVTASMMGFGVSSCSMAVRAAVDLIERR